MRLTMLGTGGSMGMPAMSCECDMCKSARAAGGDSLRLRSGALVNDDILLDCSDDLIAGAQRAGVDLSGVRHVVVTHAHIDHFSAQVLTQFCEPYAHMPNRSPLHVYGGAFVRRVMDEFSKASPGDRLSHAVFHPVKPFDAFSVSGVTFTALPALHPCPDSLTYLLSQDGARVYYGVDSGVYPQETLNALRLFSPLSAVFFDAALGDGGREYAYHMSYAQCLAMRNAMLENGAADHHTAFACTHLTHHCGGASENMRARAARFGLDIACDGAVYEF